MFRKTLTRFDFIMSKANNKVLPQRGRLLYPYSLLPDPCPLNIIPMKKPLVQSGFSDIGQLFFLLSEDVFAFIVAVIAAVAGV